jgi:hypothetical protein
MAGSLHMTGLAQLWYNQLERRGNPSDNFVELADKRFGPPSWANTERDLVSLHHTGTVADYQEQFLTRLARVEPMSERREIHLFTNNLDGAPQDSCKGPETGDLG